jgi:hypothetical protein
MTEFPIYFTTDNTEVWTKLMHLYTAGELGLNLSGMGMAGVWDGGKVRSTHQEFNNDRILLGDSYATKFSCYPRVWNYYECGYRF